MKLSELINCEIHLQNINPNTEITGITENSTQVLPGNIFIAITGNDKDGHKFIQDSINRGASLVIGENEHSDLSVPYLRVEDSREILGELLFAFYQNPFKNKKIIGVTGTNGKTTTTYFIRHLLKKHGYKVGVIGTIGYEINNTFIASSNTTPSTSILYKLFNQSTDDIIIMEVSSHGLVQKRMHKIPFDFALFTNLQKDHLDYHGTMENYFQAKSLLFKKLQSNGISIVNGDNSWGEKLLANLASEHKKTIRVGSNPESTLLVNTESKYEEAFKLTNGTDTVEIFSPLPGKYNIENLSMASATVLQLGVPLDSVHTYLKDFEGVPGRFEQYNLPNDIKVIVDYAHTAEAIDYCLETVFNLSSNNSNIYSIFGFTGKRDKVKRQYMLENALSWSKKVYLTTDDLNGVSLNHLKNETLDIVDSLFPNSPIVINMDRTTAFEKAVQDAQAGDFIVLMGMGHENYQNTFHYPVKSDKDLIEYFQNKLDNF